jgi:hypothetical protein
VRRRPPPPRRLDDDQMFWPGNVAAGVDPVVPAEQVHRVCAERMAVFDELPRELRDRINEKGIVR